MHLPLKVFLALRMAIEMRKEYLQGRLEASLPKHADEWKRNIADAEAASRWLHAQDIKFEAAQPVAPEAAA